MMSPVGKCLETALDELRTASKTTTANSSADDYQGGYPRNSSGTKDFDELDNPRSRSARKRKHATSITIGGQAESANVSSMKGKSYQNVSEELELASNSNMLPLDDSMSKSILQSYINAVALTNFDPEGRKTSIDDSVPHLPSLKTNATVAPAAILQGDIDHFNRIGGQWRIVAKNAVVKQRSTKKVENGMTGRSRRKRTVLAWDDTESITCGSDCKDACDNDANNTTLSGYVHRLKGSIQILAYDDNT
jgi:hypothetical protein